MNQLFNYFNNLVKVEFRQKMTLHPHPESTYFNELLHSIQLEKDKLLDGIRQALYEFHHDEGIKWKARNFRDNTIELANIVASSLGPEQIATAAENMVDCPTWAGLNRMALAALLEVLAMLENKFDRHLNSDVKIPVASQVLAQLQIDEPIRQLRKSMANAGVSEKLRECIEKPFLQFRKMSSRETITYQKLDFLHVMMKEVSGIFPVDPDAGTAESQLLKKLRELNYNDAAFIKYNIKVITDNVKSLSPKEGLKQLLFLQKEVNQLRLRPEMACHPSSDSIQLQLQLWLAEEINYLKEHAELNHAGSNRRKGFKVKIKCTVAEFGFFLRLLCDSGIVLNDNKSELIDFCSEYFATIKKEDISPGSLRNNFYEYNESVAASVGESLEKLVNHSKNGYAGDEG